MPLTPGIPVSYAYIPGALCFCLSYLLLIGQLSPSKFKLSLGVWSLGHNHRHRLRSLIALLQPHVVVNEEECQNKLNLISSEKSTRAGVFSCTEIQVRIIQGCKLPAVTRFSRFLSQVVKTKRIKLLGVVEKLLVDRNTSLRGQYSCSCGQVRAIREVDRFQDFANKGCW